MSDKPWRAPNARPMTFDEMAARAQYEWERAEAAEAEAKQYADRIEELEAQNELLEQMIASLPPPYPDNTLRNRLAQRRAQLKGDTND